MIFAVPEKVGALKEALTIFARNAINLSMIQSRPQRSGLREYVFILDLNGHREDPPMRQACDLGPNPRGPVSLPVTLREH